MSLQLLKELREKKAKLVADARAKNDEITADTNETRAAEIETEYDAIMADYDKIDKVHDREKRMYEAEQSLTGERDPRVPNGENRFVTPENIELIEGQALVEDAGTQYRSAFHAMLSAGGDVSDLSNEQRSALAGGGVANEHRAQLTTSGAAGGYTVPTELSQKMIESMELTGPMFNSDFVFNIDTSGGGEIDVPTLDDTGDSSTDLKSENSAIKDDGSGDVALSKRVLNAYVYATPFVKWSMELGQDSFLNVEALLGRILGKRLGKIGNTQLTVGTGANQPHGVVNAALLGHTAASGTVIAVDELIRLEHSVDPAYRNDSSSFMMHDTTIEAIRKLKDANGQYIWSMGDVQKGTPATLLGRLLVTNQAMPKIATGNRSVLFGDFKEYYVRKVGSPVLGIMRERFWPQLGIAGLVRFDGEIGDSGAIKALKQA